MVGIRTGAGSNPCKHDEEAHERSSVRWAVEIMEAARFSPEALNRMWGYRVTRVKKNMPDMKEW